MFDKRNIAFIFTALEAVEKILLYTQGVVNSDEFLEKNKQVNFNACQTLLLVIGEETKKFILNSEINLPPFLGT